MSPADKSPRLGRGLAALMGEIGPPTLETPSIQEIPVTQLEPSPFQPRRAMDPTALAELAASIKTRGILQPLLIRPHPTEKARYQIIAGERRWRAATQAGLKSIPALIRPLSDQDTMAAALVENLQRQDLNVMEEAEGYARLQGEFGLTQEDLAQAVGKSRPYITNTIRLTNLPEPVQNAVRVGTLSAGHARALLAHADPEQGLRAILARGLNVRQTEALATRPDFSAVITAPRPHKTKAPETEAMENMLTEKLGLRVEVTFDGIGGALKITYQTLEQLDEVVSRLTR
ncbi:MAG: ParB/RepB/Spo0J family partition protein [Acetobacteraceae bacterium]|nr:ParB/RepB/Spo0J family partition protein [Acetobacteraceae bacterium]MSP29245.1 ParB/RepB/Spo0J family partition protein [Acetobacteraceae bacterium]